MASTEFVAINWNPGQLIDEDSFDQMNNNINYLRDQSIDGLFQHRVGGTTSTGIKILCGTATVNAMKSATAGAYVTFAKMFSPNSNPVVVASVISAGVRPVFITITGVGSNVLPNHQGFVGRILVDNVGNTRGQITNTLYVPWIAMGY